MLKTPTTDMLYLNREGDTSKVVKSCIRQSASGDCPRSPIVVQWAPPARQKNFSPPADFGFTIGAHPEPYVANPKSSGGEKKIWRAGAARWTTIGLRGQSPLTDRRIRNSRTLLVSPKPLRKSMSVILSSKRCCADMLKSLTTDMLFRSGWRDTNKVVKNRIRQSASGDCPRSPTVVQWAPPARQKNFSPPADFGFTIGAHPKPYVANPKSAGGEKKFWRAGAARWTTIGLRGQSQLTDLRIRNSRTLLISSQPLRKSMSVILSSKRRRANMLKSLTTDMLYLNPR